MGVHATTTPPSLEMEIMTGGRFVTLAHQSYEVSSTITIFFTDFILGSDVTIHCAEGLEDLFHLAGTLRLELDGITVLGCEKVISKPGPTHWVYADRFQNCDDACERDGKVCVEGNFPSSHGEMGMVHDEVARTIDRVFIPQDIDSNVAPPSVYRFPRSQWHSGYSSGGRAPCNAIPVESGNFIDIHRYCGCEASPVHETPIPTSLGSWYKTQGCLEQDVQFRSMLAQVWQEVPGIDFWEQSELANDFCWESKTLGQGFHHYYWNSNLDTRIKSVGVASALTCCERFAADSRSCIQDTKPNGDNVVIPGTDTCASDGLWWFKSPKVRQFD